MEALGFTLRQEAVLETLTTDVIKSSEIEGEKLEPEQVRSSVAGHLGMDAGGLKAADRNVDGIVEMMLDATRRYDQPLTDERLFAWHASLFPTGRSGMTRIRAGTWRDDSTGPMEVVSGAIGKERVGSDRPWQCLYFFPLPHGQEWLRPTLGTTIGDESGPPTLKALGSFTAQIPDGVRRTASRM